jgi:hypothetical protein
MAEFQRSLHCFRRIFRAAEAQIRDVMIPLELLEHVVGPDAVAPVQGMEQAAIDPQDAQLRDGSISGGLGHQAGNLSAEHPG